MPKVMSNQPVNKPCAIKTVKKNKRIKKIRCPVFSGKWLKKVRAEVSCILRGERTPQWYLELCHQPNIWHRRPISYKCIKQPQLSCLYECALALELEKNKIGRSVYEKWNSRYAQLSLREDVFFQSIGNFHLSPRAIELSEKFYTLGPDRFSCRELRAVVENIRAIIGFELEQEEVYAKCELDYFHLQLSLYLDGVDDVTYWHVHGICILFILFLHEYEEGLEFYDKKYTSRSNLNKYTNIDFNLYIKFFESGESVPELLGGELLKNYVESVREYASKDFLWPSFEPLNADFFERCDRYNISPLGLLASRWAFHDGTLYDRREFYLHDVAHSKFIKRCCHGCHEQKQKCLVQRGMLVRKVTTNPIVGACIKKLGFIRVHEELLNDNRRNLLEYDPDYFLVTRQFATTLHHYDDLPTGLTKYHIQAASYLMEEIEPYLPKNKNDNPVNKEDESKAD